MTEMTMAALRAAEMLKSFGGSTGNPLNALMSFLQPLLADRDRQRLDNHEFAQAVREAYGWNFTDDVADGFRRTLVDQGWLKTSIGENNRPRMEGARPLQIVCCPPNPDERFEQPLDDVIGRMTTAFKAFLHTRAMPIEGVYKNDEDIVAAIVSHLVENLGQAAGTEVSAYDPVDEGSDDATVIDHAAQRTYQVFSFVDEMQRNNDPLANDFARIAAVGLIAELAQDFSKPTAQVSKTKVSIFLDSPIAHDLLGVGGREAAEQARSIMKKLQDMGATVSIFDQSVKEMQTSLRTILNKNPADRFGAIQEAFLRGELTEAYVYTIVSDPVKAFENFGVQVKQPAFQAALKPDGYFSKEQYWLFYDRMVSIDQFGSGGVEARSRHDANAVAYIMRLRRGHESDDLFSSQQFFLTRNRAFASLARNFCIQQELISQESVGPFVNMHDLAASLWLRTGLYETSLEIPRRRLLAGCERVLALKRPVIQKAQRAILKLRERPDMDAEKVRQIEAILTQDRSRTLIADRIRGAMEEVDDEALLDIYRRVLSEEEMKGYEKGRLEIAEDRDRVAREKQAVEAELAKERDAAQTTQRELGSEVAVLRGELDSAAVGLRNRLDALIDEVNQDIKRRKLLIGSGLAVLAGVLLATSVWKEAVAEYASDVVPGHTGMASPLILLIVGTLPALVLFADQGFRIAGREQPIERLYIEPWAKRRFLDKAFERGLWKVAGPDPQEQVVYESGRIVLRSV